MILAYSSDRGITLGQTQPRTTTTAKCFAQTKGVRKGRRNNKVVRPCQGRKIK